MPDHYQLVVVLGCFGFRVDDFIECVGVENVILKCGPGVFSSKEMMDYFDGCRLFDKPLLELNAVRNFVYNLQNRFDRVDRPLWTKQKFDLYQKFVVNHRNCGVYVKLAAPVETLPPPEEPTIIQPSDSSIRTKLKLIRGRR